MKPRYPGDHIKFKAILDKEYNWPCEYMFKFIVPKDSLPQVEALFPNNEIQFRDSRKGNYVSATISLEVDCADLVIAIYEKAAKINGLIAL
ncbi:MAG: DUF493 family protein [Bdellovibrionaceae bacterium]|nr:DUF493 family protein [Bdellovibrionales bacterium]MCB9083287.1 DUF493 family protein [Pseudobdellovibrionaceae bacterium]